MTILHKITILYKKIFIIIYPAPGAIAVYLDHIWPVKLHFQYITKKEALNSGFWWSMRSDQIWSRPLALPFIDNL
jgi:hypothetical protein